ncbi:MAG: hypothetical protein QME12_03725 [Nanoarchaeota archaeon]|nr:hypothetical protein [Nanoarchaeota archaeon]
MAKSNPITASCGALCLCSYLSFQVSCNTPADAGTEDVWRVYTGMVNSCPVFGSCEQEATCLSTELPDLLSSHLSPDAWVDKDRLTKAEEVFKPCAHGCQVASGGEMGNRSKLRGIRPILK